MFSSGRAILFFIATCLCYTFIVCNVEGKPQQTCKLKVILNENSIPKEENEHKTSHDGGTAKRRLKILIHNPAISWSHSQFQGALADVLVDAGHEVHLLTYSLNTQIGNYTGSSSSHKIIWHIRPTEKEDAVRNLKSFDELFGGVRHHFWSGAMYEYAAMQADVCKELLENDELLDYLKVESYDLAISEPYDLCAFGIFKHVGVQTSTISQAVAITSTVTSFFGIPNFSSFVYDLWTVASSDPLKMNFYERAINFFSNFFDYYTIRDLWFNTEQPIFDEAFGDSAPSLREVMRNVSLAFVNSKEFFSLPRPLSHKIVYVGGIAEKEKQSEKVLPEEFNSIMNKAAKGVILFSFGTFADTTKMPQKLREAFTEAFASFPDYLFIWKFNLQENDTVNASSNVHVFKWIPQRAILEHPKLRVFISHCGMNSANEAAKAGVPVLAIPLFGDQAYNAAIVTNKGFGLAIDIRDVQMKGASAIVSALHQLLSEPRFAENALIVGKKLNLTPFSPHEKFVKWVEFAAQFPELNELNMPTDAEMGIFVYYSLDVILACGISLLSLMIATFWLLICGVRLTVRNLPSNTKMKLTKNKKQS